MKKCFVSKNSDSDTHKIYQNRRKFLIRKNYVFKIIFKKNTTNTKIIYRKHEYTTTFNKINDWMEQKNANLKQWKFLLWFFLFVRGIINKKTVLQGHENVQAALLDYTLTCYPSVTVSVKPWKYLCNVFCINNSNSNIMYIHIPNM